MKAVSLPNMPLPNDMSLSFLLNGWLPAAIRMEIEHVMHWSYGKHKVIIVISIVMHEFEGASINGNDAFEC